MLKSNKLLVSCLSVFAMIATGATNAEAYEELESFDGGIIKGTVKLSKSVPKPKKISVTKDHGVCGKNIPDETYIVGTDKGFANVVVFLEKVRKGKKVGTPTAEIDNKGCRFVPHVSAFPVGTKLFIRNSDNTFHNAHSYLDGSRSLFNVALPMKGVRISKKIKKAGIIEYKCDAGHTWMRGWSYVTEHPYVTVTDGEGNFELTDIPAGRYRVAAWHEAEGERRVDGKVSVSAGEATTVNITY